MPHKIDYELYLNQVVYEFYLQPHEIKELYDRGFCGVRQDRSSYYCLRTKSQRFYDAFPKAKGFGRGKVSAPYKAALILDPEFGIYEAQTTGDCVSHCTRNCGMIDYCVDALFGETSFEGRLATEPIYGYRGHGGQGASCSRLAEYVSLDGPGGFLPRKQYASGSNSVDLSVYKSSIGHNWGRSGTPSWLNEIAAENKALRVYALKSVEEAVDALSVGFGISMCSGLGFSSTRNKDGVAKRQGGWSHAMAWVGVDDSPWAHDNYGGPLFLVQNSWGEWNSGGKRHEQPNGSFFIEPSVSKSMISNGGGWVIASVRGFNRELVYDTHKQIVELSNE